MKRHSKLVEKLKQQAVNQPTRQPICRALQLILFLFYCLAFWFGGLQVDKGRISFENMIKVGHHLQVP